MVITLSHPGAFRIQTGGLTIVTEGAGNVPARMKPDIFLRSSHGDAALPEAGFTVRGPGEYEIRGVEIRGIAPFTYILKAEDLRIAFISEPDLAALEEMTRIDIAFVMKAEGAGAFLRQLAPRMAIAAQGIAEPVAKESGAELVRTDKVTVKKRDLAADSLQFICLTA